MDGDEMTRQNDPCESQGHAQNRAVGLLCVIVGSIIFLGWGSALGVRASSGMVDFRAIYYNVRVLLNHSDPYNTVNGTQIAIDEGDKPKVYPIPIPSEITCVYPPSALLVNLMLGFLHWSSARIVWLMLNGAGLVLSGLLLWDIGADYAPLITGLLIGFSLANSASLLLQGNVAGIVVSLCIISVWCFFRNRFAPVAIVCLAVSLAIKPHDSGLVWLCLLFGGLQYRKRALQVALVDVALILASVLWVSSVAPAWASELKANLAAVSARGAGNDPGPSSASNVIENSDINLQTVVAVFKDEPRFYNLVSYVICAGLLLIWVAIRFRSPMTPFRFWISLAFFAALSLLPVYHRHHDAKLLMLAVPACAMIWSRRRTAGVVALLITSLALAINADVPRVILTNLEEPIVFSAATLSGKLMIILLARPAPLSILAMAIFYLWVYWLRLDEEKVELSLGAAQ